MKKLPNILSVSRIIISGLLFFLGGYPVLFTILYLYCGVSDIADGYIARRWKAESDIGAKLDSLGDFVFYLLITAVFFIYTELLQHNVILWLVVTVIIIRLLNVVITKVKFSQWGMVHTLGNKLSGLFIYFLLPVYILFPEVPVTVGIVVISIALTAAIEETLILLTAKQYNLNQKSIFGGTFF
ncbi:CDP-alcohol phosphatidyltransferase family protein [uncultured Proteiniphilum sp.]|uniref:CDP-alcohol phosphatidyltransferase family protein n=1 Tax=uncultured Proteiniphilum sp. TaxID=497637 RepID=UPI0026310766|nr:CDP-alcohol phosphatidyltransferase family protein [uncultured Proteiniphilum sp.]